MPKPKVTASAEYLIHQYHWLHAKQLRELVDENEDETLALECSALLHVAFAIEAHANRLLELGCPAEYDQERVFFSKGPYRGTLGKLDLLAERLSVPLDWGARPFQSVRDLFDWRDRMVHARTERVERVSYTDPTQVKPPESDLLAFPGKFGERTVKDCEATADALQAAAESARWNGVLSPTAFSGFLGLRGVSIS